jgi:hypothetical protein
VKILKAAAVTFVTSAILRSSNVVCGFLSCTSSFLLFLELKPQGFRKVSSSYYDKKFFEDKTLSRLFKL